MKGAIIMLNNTKKVLTQNIDEIVDWFKVRNSIDQKNYSTDHHTIIPTISQLKS